METMKFINPTDKPVSLKPVGFGIVAPGETVDIPLDLCAPTKAQNGSRGKSTLEQVAPQLRPADPAEGQVWSEMIPPDPPQQSLAVTIAGRAPGVPAGVLALREAKQKAAQEKAQASKAPKKD